MGARTERVKRLVDGFVNDFQNGMDIPEIAEKYGVSLHYTYQLLDEIAQNHGISKERFYQREHGFHVVTDKTGRIIPSKSGSFKDIYESLDEAERLLNKSSKTLASLQTEMEATLKEMESLEKER